MTPAVLHDYADRIERDLRGNILPFWLEHVRDRDDGTFLGFLGNDLVPDYTVERGALLTSRILWTFAAAYRRYREPDLLAMADHAYADLLARFHDPVYGGFYWSVAADGSVLHDRKHVYGQAFAMYALSEYYAASGASEPLEHAVAVHRLLETHARDREYGGYFEAFARDWTPITDHRLSDQDLNEPKSQNTHLHVMEAYTNLLTVWPDEALRRAQLALVETMLTRIVQPDSSHLGVFFAADWTLRSTTISYGHDIEAAWLLVQAAEKLHHPMLSGHVKRVAVAIAAVTLAEGVDSDGAILASGDGNGVSDTQKVWWPQAEALVGFINAFELSGEERFLAAALRVWDFIETRLIDHQHGEWWHAVSREGDPIPGHAKVSFWKCPYHNGRAALEASERLRHLIATRALVPGLPSNESRP